MDEFLPGHPDYAKQTREDHRITKPTYSPQSTFFGIGERKVGSGRPKTAETDLNLEKKLTVMYYASNRAYRIEGTKKYMGLKDFTQTIIGLNKSFVVYTKCKEGATARVDITNEVMYKMNIAMYETLLAANPEFLNEEFNRLKILLQGTETSTGSASSNQT